MDHISKMILGASARLRCGLDLERVFPVNEASDDYLEIGGNRIDWEVVDYDGVDDYILSLKCNVGTMAPDLESYSHIAEYSKWLVVANGRKSDAGLLEVYICADVIVSGDLQIDSRVLGYALDSIVASAQDFQRHIEFSKPNSDPPN